MIHHLWWFWCFIMLYQSLSYSSSSFLSFSGWWFQPLWKILVNWDDCSQYMEKKNVPNHKPVLVSFRCLRLPDAWPLAMPRELTKRKSLKAATDWGQGRMGIPPAFVITTCQHWTWLWMGKRNTHQKDAWNMLKAETHGMFTTVFNRRKSSHRIARRLTSSIYCMLTHLEPTINSSKMVL